MDGWEDTKEGGKGETPYLCVQTEEKKIRLSYSENKYYGGKAVPGILISSETIINHNRVSMVCVSLALRSDCVNNNQHFLAVILMSVTPLQTEKG